MIFWILFLLLPVIEIALFIQVAGAIGFFDMVLLCLGMAIVGGTLVWQQGLQTLVALQGALDRGEMPVEKIFDGMCLFFAGVFFILPGFFSDFLGSMLLIPPLRDRLRHYAGRYLGGGQEGTPADSDILDVEYTRIDDDNRPLPP